MFRERLKKLVAPLLVILTGSMIPSCSGSTLSADDYRNIRGVKYYPSEFKNPAKSRTLRNIYIQAKQLEAIRNARRRARARR